MLYGSETWTVREDDVQRLVSTVMRMMRRMCGASLNARHTVTDDELRDILGLECISVVMKRGRLGWFSHVERMDDGNKVKGGQG